MIPIAFNARNGSINIPRASGDDPEMKVNNYLLLLYSPRERG